MFTGLIEAVGSLAALQRRGDGGGLTVAFDGWDSPLAPGESIAVSGVCLTVTSAKPGQFTCDLLGETLARTNLGGKKPGSMLNLERALKAGDRMGGHYVQGHVDGVGKVVSMRDTGADLIVEIGCDKQLLCDILMKGSIACDGVSLTVAALSANSFSVHLIPTTREKTAFRRLARGNAVNIETDVLGKYARQHATMAAAHGGITMEDLAKAGYAV